MSINVGIISYEAAGNLHSVRKAVLATGASTTMVKNTNDLGQVDRLILPGVGSFRDAIDELRHAELYESIQEMVKKVPVLGICLGMQILSKFGSECGSTSGFDVFDATVSRIPAENRKIPHVGFNTVNVLNDDFGLFNGIEDNEFYFMHSYEALTSSNILSKTTYMGHEFISSMQNDRVFGVQFHPEKSRDAGIELLRNFINLN